jgi:hypothetical protein
MVSRGAGVVSYSRFYPDGYIGLEQGTLQLAKARNPDDWQTSKMLPGENAVWNRFGFDLNAQFVDLCLFSELKLPFGPARSVLFDRYCSFLEAQSELRRALHRGAIVGEFLDEGGKWGYLFAAGWGGDAGEIIIGRGIADVSDGPFHYVTRLVLLNKSRLDDLIRDPNISTPPPCKGMEFDRLAAERGNGHATPLKEHGAPPAPAFPLTSGAAGRPSSTPKNPSDEEVSAILMANQNEIRNGRPGSVSQEEARGFLRKMGWPVDYKQVAKVVTALKGHNKPGPQGPRR